MPFSTDGMKLRGMAPPKTLSSNSKSLPRGERLHLDPDVAELAAAAGLLLVPALDVGLAFDRLLVGDLRRLEVDVDVVALLEPLGDDPDVELAVAGDEELGRVRVAIEPDRRVFLDDPVRRRRDPVLVGPGLGLDGERNGRFGELDRREGDPGALGAQGITGRSDFELGRGGDVPRLGLARGYLLLALEIEQPD